MTTHFSLETKQTENWRHCCCCCSVLSPVQPSATSWTAACQTSLSFTIFWNLLKHTSSRWCYHTISSSVIPFSCLQSFPASGSSPMSQFFASGGQSIGVSGPSNEYSGLIFFVVLLIFALFCCVLNEKNLELYLYVVLNFILL